MARCCAAELEVCWVHPITLTVGDERAVSLIVGAEKYAGDTVPLFDGPYEVTPLAFAQTVLETRGKRMADDVTVVEIPYVEAGNGSGGLTVSIAS